jgi:DNA-binding NtrC family response regulator
LVAEHLHRAAARDPSLMSGLLSVVRDLEAMRRGGRAGTDAPDSMVGQSEAMMLVFEKIRTCASTRAPVLITGETGTGKELAARALHERSECAAGPFVAINCAGLPTGLIASELFGHERGAFTGANAQRIGKIEAADGGTLLLDEIGDLPLDVQGNLLRFLQEGTIERLGSSMTRRLNVRVVAATHVDLQEAVTAGRFRQDLFYRLNVLTIHMPPLRARRDDVLLIARYLLNAVSREYGRHFAGFAADAESFLRTYDWPGNIRELAAAVRRACLTARGETIHAADFGIDGAERCQRRSLDANTLAQMLEACDGNITRIAHQLGVSRPTVYKKMREFGLRQ